MSSTPATRRLAAKVAAHARWAREPDREKATRAARRGLLARFAAEVDPEFLLSDADRMERAQQLLAAHMASMSLKAANARTARTLKGATP